MPDINMTNSYEWNIRTIHSYLPRVPKNKIKTAVLPSDYLITSDSKSVFHTIGNTPYAYTLRIKDELHELKDLGFIVIFLWIPSHTE